MTEKDNTPKEENSLISSPNSNAEENNNKDEQDEQDDNVNEVLQALPPPIRELVSTQLTVGLQGRIPNPIVNKLTPEHIDKIIDNDENVSKREDSLIRNSRIYTLGYTLLAIVAFLALYLIIGKDDPQLFKEILIYFGTFFAGFGVGWGYKAKE